MPLGERARIPLIVKGDSVEFEGSTSAAKMRWSRLRGLVSQSAVGVPPEALPHLGQQELEVVVKTRSQEAMESYT